MGAQHLPSRDSSITITNAPENKDFAGILDRTDQWKNLLFSCLGYQHRKQRGRLGDSTTAFTTVNSLSVRENSDAIRYSDWKVSGNWTVICTIHLGNNRHADPGSTVAFSPSDLSNLYTWYDASGYSSAPATLTDKSGNGYNLANSSTGGGSLLSQPMHKMDSMYLPLIPTEPP